MSSVAALLANRPAAYGSMSRPGAIGRAHHHLWAARIRIMQQSSSSSVSRLGSKAASSPISFAILRKAHACGQPLFLVSVDVDMAFDQVNPKVVARAMLYHKTQAWGIAAVLRELVAQEAWPILGEVETEKPVELGTRAEQGASGPPALYDLIVSAFTARLVET